MTTTGMRIKVNGLRIYYEVHGEGEPLLLAHGATATSQSWASHLATFTEHFRVFTPDSRGHRRTDNPTGELSYRLMADDVAALVGALGLQEEGGNNFALVNQIDVGSRGRSLYPTARAGCEHLGRVWGTVQPFCARGNGAAPFGRHDASPEFIGR